MMNVITIKNQGVTFEQLSFYDDVSITTTPFPSPLLMTSLYGGGLTVCRGTVHAGEEGASMSGRRG